MNTSKETRYFCDGLVTKTVTMLKPNDHNQVKLVQIHWIVTYLEMLVSKTWPSRLFL